jgi:hypothetical protein
VSRFIRVTKWISKKEKIKTGEWGTVTGEKFVHNEREQIQERTGDECIVRVGQDNKLAIFRDM